MAWIYLLIASVFEIMFALGLKYTEGFSRLVPSLIALYKALGGGWEVWLPD